MLPGQPMESAASPAPVGLKRGQPSQDITAIREAGKPGKGMVERRGAKPRLNQQALQPLENNRQPEMANVPPAAPNASPTSTPLMLDVAPVKTAAAVVQATNAVDRPGLATVGISDGVELRSDAKTNASDDRAEAMQYCANEKTSS